MDVVAAKPVPLRKNRAFLLLVGGQTVSVLGANASGTAYPLLVLALTGSAGDAGIVAFFATLPFALCQLPAGALVDRWNRKRLMVICDVGRGSLLAGLALAVWLGELSIGLIAAIAFLESTLGVFFNLAEVGAVRNVVASEQLPAALAQNEARTRGAGLAGGPVGGVLFGLGRALPFLVDALSYLASLVTLLLIRAGFNEERAATSQSLLADVIEGVRWLWRQAFLRDCMLMVAGSNLIFKALSLVVIVLARERGASAAEIGFIFGLTGGGGFLGSFVAPWVQERLRPTTIVVGTNWVWVLLLPLMAIPLHPLVLGLLFGAMAFVGPAWNVTIGTYQMRMTPDALMGRVSSAASMISWGVMPLGALLGGAMLETVSPTAAIFVCAGLMLVVAVAATGSRTIREGPTT